MSRQQDINLTVTGPNVKVKFHEKYELRNIRKEFNLPDFQRKISPPHVLRIHEAILRGKFYNIVVSFYEDSKGRKQLLDGQQRLEALAAAHEMEKLQFYPLVTIEYEEKFARQAFRRINMGRPLQTRDHTVALDDGSVEFFNSLKPYLSHQQTPAKQSFLNMLNAINYAKTGKPMSIQASKIEDVLESITKRDIEEATNFCLAYSRALPVVSKQIGYKPSIYRNIYRVGAHEKRLDSGKLIDLIKLAAQDKEFKSMKSQNMQSIIMGYKIISDKLLPKVSKR